MIYHIAGYILHSVSKNYSVCETCLSPCISEFPFLKDFTKYTVLKDYTGSALLYVTEPTYMFFVALERILRENVANLLEENNYILSKLISLMKSVSINIFEENCHDIRNKIIDRFATFRLRIHQSYKSRTNKYDSRSMAV